VRSLDRVQVVQAHVDTPKQSACPGTCSSGDTPETISFGGPDRYPEFRTAGDAPRNTSVSPAGRGDGPDRARKARDSERGQAEPPGKLARRIIIQKDSPQEPSLRTSLRPVSGGALVDELEAEEKGRHPPGLRQDRRAKPCLRQDRRGIPWHREGATQPRSLRHGIPRRGTACRSSESPCGGAAPWTMKITVTASWGTPRRGGRARGEPRPAEKGGDELRPYAGRARRGARRGPACLAPIRAPFAQVAAGDDVGSLEGGRRPTLSRAGAKRQLGGSSLPRMGEIASPSPGPATARNDTGFCRGAPQKNRGAEAPRGGAGSWCDQNENLRPRRTARGACHA
jgi:hypothetical protein